MIKSWTIYDHPRDMPDYFVARMFEGETPTPTVVLSKTLEPLRQQMIEMGLFCFERAESDDPKIVETWL